MKKRKAGRSVARQSVPASKSISSPSALDNPHSRNFQALCDTSALQSVYCGRSCVGFLLARGRDGVEAFDADERSLGLFANAKAAHAAIVAASREAARP